MLRGGRIYLDNIIREPYGFIYSCVQHKYMVIVYKRTVELCPPVLTTARCVHAYSIEAHSGTSILKYLHSNLFISIVYCTNVKTTTKPWSAFCPASAPAAPLRAAPRAHQLRARAAPAPHGGGTPPPSQVIWAPWHVQDGPGPRSEWVARSTSGSRRSEPCPALSPTAPSVRSQLLQLCCSFWSTACNIG